MNDDELLARLRAADPAESLPPADPDGVARLVEDVMSTELTRENRETGTRQRSPLTWAVAAAAVLVIAGAGFLGVRALTDDGGSVPPGADQAAPSVTRLEVPEGAGAGKCMVPNADTLAQADVAFAGTVTAIDGDDVTLAPSHWYVGGPADEVVVTAPSEQMQRVASGVSFQVGGRYLVSALEGQVSLCGFSAAYDDDLAAVYQEAFG